MNGEQNLSVGEFQRSMQSLERTMAQGLARTDERFNALDEKIDVHTARIAAIEATASLGKTKSAGWSVAIAATAIAVAETVRRF